jgi:hypothetical protein
VPCSSVKLDEVSHSLVTALVVISCGCTPPKDAYEQLQDAMKRHIAEEDHRPVESVDCTPHVHDTMREEVAKLRCVVHFTNGSSYTAAATIENQNSGGRHNMPDLYSWDSPPHAE